jgi:hypothetical protein
VRFSAPLAHRRTMNPLVCSERVAETNEAQALERMQPNE